MQAKGNVHILIAQSDFLLLVIIVKVISLILDFDWIAKEME